MTTALLALCCALAPLQGDAGQNHGFRDLDGWTRVAPGVWSAEIGDVESELAWSDLAAAPPRLDALNAMDDAPFPFEGAPIQFVRTDGRIGLSIPSAVDARIYGFGLQFDGIDKSQKVLDLKADHWSKGGGRTHAPTPLYVSSEGHGVFIDTARYVRCRTHTSVRKDATERPPEIDRNPVGGFRDGMPRWRAMPRARAVEADLHAKGVRVVVFAGDTPLEIVRRYNLWSGGGALPPLWALGIWHRVPASHDADQTLAEVAAFAENDIPLDVIGLEPGWMTASYPCTFEWQTKRFPDPAAFVGALREVGVRVNLWENPYVASSAALYEPLLPLSGTHLVWNGIVPDPMLEEAARLVCEQHDREHVAIGVSGYKTDEVDGFDRWLWPDHAVFPSGTPAETLRQSYGTLLQKHYLERIFRPRDLRTCALVRSMGGCASGYPSVVYSDAYDHRQYITGVASGSLCGVLWCPEIRSARSPREWAVRAQTAAFSPLTQINAWSSGILPWSFEGATESVREAFELRLQLLPYLYSAYARYHLDGTPPFRAMILEEGARTTRVEREGAVDGERNPYGESTVITATDQYMFGPSILVAPYHGAKSDERTVELPPGDWFDFHTGRAVGGGDTITISGRRTPLFVKGGAVIPMLRDTVTRTRDAVGAPLEVRVFGGAAAASGELYEDDGESFGHTRGAFRWRTVSVDADGGVTESVRGEGPALFGRVERAVFPAPE
ncbi:MAG: TIM-barrel domain-containing protein [Planctomycetota bacterium]